MARRQSDGRTLKVSVKSQLKFSPESEPASDAALSELARVFSGHFCETLKTGTGAAEVRTGDSAGRKNAGETDNVFFCTYAGAAALNNAVELFAVMNSIPVAWAHRDWRQMIPGVMSVNCKVSVDSIASGAAERVTDTEADNPRGRRLMLGWLASVLIAFLLGMAAAWADARITHEKPIERKDAATQLVKSADQQPECAPAKEAPAAAAAPVTLNCNCPSVRLSCPSREREDETSKRWESLSR
jgi:hypothetical protein